LKIFDTLSKTHRSLENGRSTGPAGKKRPVKIFVCGPTVYEYCHLGHARVFLLYDLIARLLRFRGEKATLVMNITDIDPKISTRAKRNGEMPEKTSNRFTRELFSDLSNLGINGIGFARVSDYVETSRQIVLKLLGKKVAYPLNGNIYLDTSKTPLFGQLSGLNKKELSAMRFDIAPNKRNPNDLLLWNSTDIIGYNYQDKTIGSGFPSAHLQDLSVLIALFKGNYHLHGGAADLIYPHHESILAQLIELTSLDRPVKCWNHIGLVLKDGKKMSNSLNNAIPIRTILHRYDSNILRLYFFSEPYRSPMHFSESILRNIEKINLKIARTMSTVNITGNIRDNTGEDLALKEKFLAHIENDFNTPSALRVLINTAEKEKPSASILEMVQILGLRY
jgi:cysteinyl-tRNA synthetase